MTFHAWQKLFVIELSPYLLPHFLNSKVKTTNTTNTPAILGKRIADSLRSLYVRANKNRIENNTTAGMSISEMKLQKSLNEIDLQGNDSNG